MTRLLAIDPGTSVSAWVFLEDGQPVRSRNERPNYDVLNDIVDLAPDLVAVEMIQSMGMSVGAEIFETVFYIGRFTQGARKRQIPVCRILRSKIKMHLCGSTRATDSNIRTACIDHFGPGKDKAIGRKGAEGPCYGIVGDAWQALACGLTFLGTPETERVYDF